MVDTLKDHGVPVEDITGARHAPSTEQGDRFFRGKPAGETLAERKARVEKELHQASWQIERIMDHGVPVRRLLFAVEDQPPKPIYGKVLAVRPEVNLVMLNLGTDDNVKKGYRFTVYDGERYVGKVEVERPFSDMCSARILTDWTKEEIREGYDASTALGGGEAISAPGSAPRKDEPAPERSPRWLAARKLLGEDSSETEDRERIRRRVETSGRIEKADEPEWEKDLRRKLDRKVTFEFADTPLSEALQFLQTLTKTPIDIDAKALKDGAGKAPITLKVTKMPLRTALKWVLRLADMDYAVRDDGVLVSTWKLPPEKAPTGEAKRKAEEAARRKAEQERRRRIEAERKRLEEEKRRKEEEARRKEEEAARLAAEEAAPPPPVNPFVLAARDRFSTFALDTDTASYTIARNYVSRGRLPPPVRIRMEEFVNAFDYNYPTQAKDTFNIHAEGTAAPFGRGLYLLKLGVQAKVLGREGRKPAHLVFVVDTSGSMEKPDRLPLVKLALGMLVGELSGRDRVSLVTYGTKARLVLEAVAAAERKRIHDTIASLQCGGSTNLHEGVKLGYEIAKRHFRSGDINRVILCSDGVANVGSSVAGDIVSKAEMFREWGVTLTTAGFGAGSYNDEMLEKLANSGDGNYVFIDSEREARRVFVDEMSATLQTVAKDAKIQVEFDPRTVRRYRLIGYENRAIKDKQFRDDTVDAGEVGSGQAATALYEIELVGRPVGRSKRTGDLGIVYVRYKNIDTGKVEEISERLGRGLLASETVKRAPRLFLAACAAEFAEVLRGSEHARGAMLGPVERVLVGVTNELPLDGKVAELFRLVQRAKSLRGER
ncbi:MAG: vWA domain-containing protein [Planctomycetota bacterium]